MDISKHYSIELNKINNHLADLDVYIFYGSSQKDLQSRWCVGFNSSNASQLIDLLNTQGPFIIADKNPKNWQDKNGKSYSIVMLTGIMEHEPSEELIKGAKLCLTAIQNVTTRKLTVHTIQ